MSDPTVYLDTFPSWLKTLASDVGDFAPLLRAEALSETQRRFVAGGVNYIFKSLDLIPDGIEDLGYIDDAFVIRVAAALVDQEAPGAPAPVRRLAAEASTIRDFLGPDYPRLEAYVRALTKGAARGRSVDEVIGDPGTRDTLLGEVSSWVASYQVPSFQRDEKNLVKLRAFLDSKLPRP
jgi:uncharacterized membrane protein YkvA (DUF1232 family)